MLDQNILCPGLKASVMLINLKLVFVVVNFFTSGTFFCFFWGMVMYANKVETKAKRKTQDEITCFRIL